MSKAFTRESDDIEPDEIQPVRPPLPPGASNYITRAGANRVRDRLAGLLQEKKGAPAGQPGPAVADQRRLESAIRRLEAILASVVIAEPPADQGKVAFGASVLVRHQDGEEGEYRIVGVDEADPARDRISWISPLARALLNHRAGDKVRFRSPAGIGELTILNVRYDPE